MGSSAHPPCNSPHPAQASLRGPQLKGQGGAGGRVREKLVILCDKAFQRSDFGDGEAQDPVNCERKMGKSVS